MADLDGSTAASQCGTENNDGQPDPGGTGASSLATYVVNTSSNAPVNAQIMDALSAGLARILANGSFATIADGTADTGDVLTWDGSAWGPAAPSGGGSSYYQTLKANGTPQTQRAAINFASLFSLTDVSGSDHTTLDLAVNMVAFNRLQQVGEFSVVGRASSGTGNLAAIGTASTGQILRHNGTQLEWGTLLSTSFANNTIVPARITTQAAKSVLGVTGNATAAVDAIAGVTAGHLPRINAANTALEFGTLIAESFADNTVALARLANAAAPGVVGKFTTGAGSQTVLLASAGSDGQALMIQADGSIAWETPGGGTPTGTATNIAFFNGSGNLAASGITLASNVLTHAISASGSGVSAVVSNTSNSASSTANFTVRTAGTSAGNPSLTLGITSGVDWTQEVVNTGLTYDTDPWVLYRAGVAKLTATTDFVYFGGSGTAVHYNGANRITSDLGNGIPGAVLFAGATAGTTEQTALALSHRNSGSVDASVAIELYPGGGIGGGVMGSGESKIVGRYLGAGLQQLALAVKNPSNAYQDRLVCLSGGQTYVIDSGSNITYLN